MFFVLGFFCCLGLLVFVSVWVGVYFLFHLALFGLFVVVVVLIFCLFVCERFLFFVLFSF